MILIGISFFFYFLLGIPDNVFSDRTTDFFYLITYFFKIFTGFALLFLFINIFKSKEDLNFFFISASIFLSFIICYLAYKYLVQYDKNFIGVVVDDSLGGMKSFKNSFATSTALIAPFIFAGIFMDRKTKFYSLISFFLILFLLYWVNSRSAIIILFFEIFTFYLVSKSQNTKKQTRRGLFFVIIILILSGISFVDWINKNEAFSDGIKNPWSESASSEYNMLETHRAWLIFEAIDGYIDSSLLGNGIATFRIRESNLGHRTDTHNDYILLLYEQGTLGFLILISFIFYRIRSNVILSRKISNRYLEASISALSGLLIALVFINLIQTLVFWSILALSCVFSYQKKLFSG